MSLACSQWVEDPKVEPPVAAAAGPRGQTGQGYCPTSPGGRVLRLHALWYQISTGLILGHEGSRVSYARRCGFAQGKLERPQRETQMGARPLLGRAVVRGQGAGGEEMGGKEGSIRDDKGQRGNLRGCKTQSRG